MFFIVFNTGHACPLVFTRFLRPRIRRGASDKQPGDMNRQRPQTRQIRSRKQHMQRAQARPVRIREQSPSAFSPRKQARRRSVRVYGHTEALTRRKLAWVVGESSPKPDRDVEASGFMAMPRPNTGREFWPTSKRNDRNIAVFMFPPTCFPTPIRDVPPHAVI